MLLVSLDLCPRLATGLCCHGQQQNRAAHKTSLSGYLTHAERLFGAHLPKQGIH